MKSFHRLNSIILVLLLTSSLWAAEQERLSSAVERKDQAAVRQMLDKGASRDEKNEALFSAAKNNSPEIVESLIKHGVDVNVADRRGDTPLHVAVQFNNAEIAGLLLRKGASVNAKGEQGQTPLHRAVLEGNRKIVELLLLEGADINARDNSGDTALMMAERAQADADNRIRSSPQGGDRDRASLLPLLIKFNADVNEQNRSGNTALHQAVYNGKIDSVRTLLAAGADPGIGTLKGETALDYAQQAGNQDIVKLLKDAEAQGNSATKTEPKGRDAALMNVLRPASVPLSQQWEYKIAFFDERYLGDREGRLSEWKKRLSALNSSKDSEAYADLSREIAALLQWSDKNQEAEPYREQAEELYRALLKKNPKSAPLLYKLALTQRMAPEALNKKTGALSSLNSAIKSNADFCLPYSELLEENVNNKAWLDRAEQCFKRSIKKKDSTAADHFEYHRFIVNRTVYQYAARRPGAPEDSFSSFLAPIEPITSDLDIALVKKAVELEPGSIQYRASLASLLTGKIFFDWMRNVSRLQQSDGPLETLLSRSGAMTHEKLPDLYKSAEEYFIFVDNKAKDIYPWLYAQWAILMMTDGRIEPAEKALLKSISIEPAESNFYETLVLLAWQWLPQGSDRQQETFDRIASLLQKKCEAKCTTNERLIIARLRFGQGRYGDVVRNLRTALREDPSSLPLKTSLAVTLVKMGRRDLAAPEIRAAEAYYARSERMDQAHFCSFMAVLSLLENNKEGALKWLQDALKLNPEDPVAAALVKE